VHAQETNRTAMAIGADRGSCDKEGRDAGRRQILKAWREGGRQLVILGKQAIDDDSNQTGQMLAALMAGARQPSLRRSSSATARSLRDTAMGVGGLETDALKLPVQSFTPPTLDPTSRA